jgi:hypothetical protein
MPPPNPSLRLAKSIARMATAVGVIAVTCFLATACVASAIAFCACDHSGNAVLPAVLGVLFMLIGAWASQGKVHQFSLEPIFKWLKK